MNSDGKGGLKNTEKALFLLKVILHLHHFK